MQKTVIACCVGALFAAGTAAAATHEQDGKTGIAGEGAALTVNAQTDQIGKKPQIIGGWWHYPEFPSRFRFYTESEPLPTSLISVSCS